MQARGYDNTYDDPDVLGDEFAAIPETGRCTSVSGVIVDDGKGGLWKLLTGKNCAFFFCLVDENSGRRRSSSVLAIQERIH